MKKILLLKGLDCPNCAAKIEKEVLGIDGVYKSEVNLLKQTLTLEIEENAGKGIKKSVEGIVHRHEPKIAVSEYEKTVASKEESNKLIITRLILGGIIFAAVIIIGLFAAIPLWAEMALLISAYVILGYDVLLKAAKNIIKGRIFDENFLMSISTLGAFFIKEYPEAVAVMLFYQTGEFFQELSVRRSRKSIADLMNIRPDRANLIKNGEIVTVEPDSVSIGDIIAVKPGERVPLDGVITKGSAMLDYAALTGESVPKRQDIGDEVLSGSIVLDSLIEIEVEKEYSQSTVAKIIDLVENAASKKAPTENFITSFARYYTPVVVILAVMLAVVPPLVINGAWTDWIHRGMVFLVISCPCALVISIPLAFFGGIGAASKRGVLIKGSNYLEALNKAKIIVFDKTGTLTKGVFKVTGIEPANSFSENELLEYAAMAEAYSNHPIAKSVLEAYGNKADKKDILNYKEISGKGVCVVYKGKRILTGNARLLESENINFVPCDKAGTKVYVGVNGQYAGCITIADEIKSDSKKCIYDLGKLGVEKTVMLTGDEENTAKSISEELNISEYHAGLLPHQKVEYLELIDSAKPAGSKLVFVGDGINDAPVLARADIGVAMGGLGSDAAIEAADMVLMTDEPSKLADAIKTAKATKRIVMQNIIIALGVKGIFLALGVFGVAGMWEAVFGDVGVALIAIFNSMRVLKK